MNIETTYNYISNDIQTFKKLLECLYKVKLPYVNIKLFIQSERCAARIKDNTYKNINCQCSRKHLPNSIFCAIHAPRSQAIHNKPSQTLIRSFKIHNPTFKEPEINYSNIEYVKSNYDFNSYKRQKDAIDEIILLNPKINSVEGIMKKFSQKYNIDLTTRRIITYIHKKLYPNKKKPTAKVFIVKHPTILKFIVKKPKPQPKPEIKPKPKPKTKQKPKLQYTIKDRIGGEKIDIWLLNNKAYSVRNVPIAIKKTWVDKDNKIPHRFKDSNNIVLDPKTAQESWYLEMNQDTKGTGHLLPGEAYYPYYYNKDSEDLENTHEIMKY